MRLLLTGILAAAALSAQTAQVRIAAQTLSKQTASAMFGNIPRSVEVAAVSFCNQSATEQVVPLSLILQEAKTSQGMTILPQSAAIALLTAKQSAGWLNQIGTYGSATAQTIGDLKLLGILQMSTPWGAAMVTGATVFGAVKRDFNPLLQLQKYLQLATSMPPDPLRMTAAGCTPTYYALVEKDKTAQTFDFGISVPPPAAK